MSDPLDSVKALAADYRRFSQNSETDDPARARRQMAIANNLDIVAEELEAARKRLRPTNSDFGDLSDLPEEVMQQLNLAKIDEFEQQLRDIVAAGSGDAVTLDQVIVALYRRHKVVKPRTYVMNKLYRMAQKGTIESVEGKKGVYRVPHAIVTQGWDVDSFDDLDSEVPF